MKRGDCEFLFSGSTMACKWMDNWSVLLYHLPLKEWMIYYQFREEKRVQRPSLRFLVLRLSNFTIATWVELILRNSVPAHIVWIESHLLDFTSAFSFVWWIITCVTSYLIYNMKHPNKLSLLDYKIVVAKKVIQYHQSRNREVPMSRPSLRKNQPESIAKWPDYQMMWKQCTYCAMEGKENRTFVIYLACNSPFCLVNERKSITFRSIYNIYFIYFR